MTELSAAGLLPVLYNPFHLLSPGADVPTECRAFIECPMRSKIKYELNKRDGTMQVSRTLHSSVHYPSNYGFIPQTYCRDHDPLDILVLSQEPVVPGCVMQARPIGMLRMMDQELEDTKIIAVHLNDPVYDNYQDISQLPPHILREMRHFFRDLQGTRKSRQGSRRGLSWPGGRARRDPRGAARVPAVPCATAARRVPGLLNCRLPACDSGPGSAESRA